MAVQQGFPDGFTPLREAAAKIGAAPGVWLSPWGGYGPPRQARLATARSGGLRSRRPGTRAVRAEVLRTLPRTLPSLLRRYGINQFKLDGTGSIDTVTPGSQFGSDFEAAIALIADLRAIKPDLFINLTTGTWPSPFWLPSATPSGAAARTTPSRASAPTASAGSPTATPIPMSGVVRAGPFFPLNSLMLHGIIYAKKAQARHRIRTTTSPTKSARYFASGTQLQEMYISHDLLTREELGRPGRLPRNGREPTPPCW